MGVAAAKVLMSRGASDHGISELAALSSQAVDAASGYGDGQGDKSGGFDDLMGTTPVIHADASSADKKADVAAEEKALSEKAAAIDEKKEEVKEAAERVLENQTEKAA